ncbi:MAG: methylmalonyl-CoA epimerase [Thermoplasmata archaeon]
MIGSAHHIGIAVRSMDAALARYRSFGLEPESIEEVPAQGVRVAFLPAGAVRLELLESLTRDGVIARFVDRRGEGLHHLAFEVTDVRSEMDRLRGEGFELVDPEPRPGARGRLVAFVHPKHAHGVLIELVQDSPEFRWHPGSQRH